MSVLFKLTRVIGRNRAGHQLVHTCAGHWEAEDAAAQGRARGMAGDVEVEHLVNGVIVAEARVSAGPVTEETER